MSATPRLALPLIAAGQAQKHVTHNEALVRLDALLHLVVASRTQAVPPAAPDEASVYIVPADGTGAFAGHAEALALFEDGGWLFLQPRPGWQAWVVDEAEHHVWTGTQWRRSQPESSLGAALWGVNTTADALNPLAVAGEGSLFSHAGETGDHRLKINKAAGPDTASLLFQKAFSGRAEIGLAGDDRLHIKVSADGESWTEALLVDPDSGAVSLPASPWAREVPQPNLVINGDFQVNQRGFAGGTLAAGTYGFDRWKADIGGAQLSRSGFTMTLTGGRVVQVLEPAVWGAASFAATSFSLSVEGLSGGELEVSLGSASATIAPGTGRRSVVLTTGAGDTGLLSLRLGASLAPVSFARVKLELGAHATGWNPRPRTEERRLCEHYYCRLDAGLFLDAYQAATAYLMVPLVLPTRMRALPVPSYTVTNEANIFGAERTVTASSPSMAVVTIRAAAVGRCYAQFSDIAFNAEL